MLKDRKKKRKENQGLLDVNSKFVSFYLKANTATVSPPLSSVFGNLGLNTMKFCKEFNALTEKLSTYFLVKVYLKIDLTTKTWTLKVGNVSTTFLFRLVSLQIKRKYTGLGGFFFKDLFYITLKNFFLIILMLNGIITKKEIFNKLAIIQSMNMLILGPAEIESLKAEELKSSNMSKKKGSKKNDLKKKKKINMLYDKNKYAKKNWVSMELKNSLTIVKSRNSFMLKKLSNIFFNWNIIFFKYINLKKNKLNISKINLFKNTFIFFFKEFKKLNIFFQLNKNFLEKKINILSINYNGYYLSHNILSRWKFSNIIFEKVYINLFIKLICGVVISLLLLLLLKSLFFIKYNLINLNLLNLNFDVNKNNQNISNLSMNKSSMELNLTKNV